MLFTKKKESFMNFSLLSFINSRPGDILLYKESSPSVKEWIKKWCKILNSLLTGENERSREPER